MKERRRANKRGVALILVLGAIATLTVMLTEFQDDATSELASALSDRDALKAEYIARSGIQLSRLLIAAEPTIRASLIVMRSQVPVWDYADQILGAFNDKEGSDRFKELTGTDMSETKNLGIEGGNFTVQIVDEDSKLNVNLASRGDNINKMKLVGQLLALMSGAQYSPLFDQRDPDGQFSDRQTICSAIIDWGDFDEEFWPCETTPTAGSRASEDAYYQLLKSPYARKNAPYDSLEELRLVRGVGDDFWATFVDPDPKNPSKRVMTVWGQGSVNVNTANGQTLWSIVCANADKGTKMCTEAPEAAKFLMAVTLLRSLLPGIPLFSSANEFIAALQGKGSFGPILSAVGLEPVKLNDGVIKTMITTDSKVFSIYADGIVPGYKRKTTVHVHAVVDFRGAPAPAAMLLVQPGSAEEQALQNAMAPNPAGTLVYFRTE